MKSLFKLAVTIGLAYFIYTLLFTIPEVESPKTIEIPKGVGVSEIGQRLKDADLIRSKFGFETLVWLKRAGSKLQAGEYTFSDVDSLADIVRVLTQGLGALNEKQFTIPEGWSMREIAAHLNERNVVSGKDFLEIVEAGIKNEELRMKNFVFLSDVPAGVGVEGYLFPDTYRVFKDAQTQDIVQKMLENFDAKLTSEMRAAIGAQGKTVFDIVRMASIVEREVPHEEDRPVIAGILWKRLDAGMALQVDSTLNYATGGKNAALTAQELAIDSPYNTYKYRGLPPAPIGNPGLSALRAAIYPQHSAYWYFLSGTDGKTHFAKDLDEHNENKARYLK
ncbi:endolytic transglycosylase MltG [Candidatus Uhrbacteria bacterium]|nr:endolytic transglycosylase MltG [Candidatus Uhrbacteria bacterium]